MLGTLAKKLRMFGFDCKYESAIDDDSLVLIAKKQDRIVLTKDLKLAINCLQHDIKTIKIQNNTDKEQLIEIAHQINYNKFQLTYSRCTLCNGSLEEIAKNTMLEKIPRRILESKEKFWKCKECNHVYWMGTHISNIEKFVTDVNGNI